jgi:hypothetical protein
MVASIGFNLQVAEVIIHHWSLPEPSPHVMRGLAAHFRVSQQARSYSNTVSLHVIGRGFLLLCCQGEAYCHARGMFRAHHYGSKGLLLGMYSNMISLGPALSPTNGSRANEKSICFSKLMFLMIQVTSVS